MKNAISARGELRCWHSRGGRADRDEADEERKKADQPGAEQAEVVAGGGEDAIEELQADLDEWMKQYNEVRTHQGRWCFGKTPMQTFLDSRPLAREKVASAEVVEIPVSTGV